jgi:hypothetical protein
LDFCNFLFPFWTQTPQGAFDRVNSRAWVPMDDTHTMFLSLSWRARRPRRHHPKRLGEESGPLAYSADVRTDGARTNVVDRNWLVDYSTFAQNRIAPNIWG